MLGMERMAIPAWMVQSIRISWIEEEGVIFTTFMPLAKVEMVVPAVVAPVVRLEEKVVLEESVEMAVHLSFTNAAVG